MRRTRLRLRDPGPGAGRRAARAREAVWAVLSAAVVATAYMAPAAGAAPGAGTAPGRAAPALSRYVLTSALPGYGVLYQGPLTAARFASYAPNPAAAATAFTTLQANPRFQAVLHSWTGPGGGGGIVDVAVAFPTVTAGASYLAGQRSVLGTTPGVRRVAVPGIPGAERHWYLTAVPVPGVEQVVTFAVGRTVVTMSFTAATGGTGAASLTAGEATSLAIEQYRLLAASPFGATPPAPSGRSIAGWVLLGVGVLVLAGMGLAAVVRRRSPARVVPGRPGGVPANGVPAPPPAGGSLANGVPARPPAGSAGPTPPGWYPDPSAPGALRFWDGSRWTGSRAVPDPAARI